MIFRRFNFAKLRWQYRTDQRLLFEATFWLAFARFTKPVVPFRWIIKLLAFEPRDQTVWKQISWDPAAHAFARRARRALRVAATCAPWHSNCLTLAVAGASMLRCRQIAATIALGVIKNPSRAGGMEAHAWLSSGGIIVTGGAGHKRYNVIATFNYGC